MANLITTTAPSADPTVSGMVLTNRSDMTDWYKLSTCPSGSAGLTLIDAVTNTAPTSSNISVATTPAKFGTGSIILPTSSVGTITLPTVSTIVTVEFWRRFTSTPSFFDFLIELNHNSSNYLLMETGGSVRGPAFASSSGPINWTVAVNTFEHYVVVIDTANPRFRVAKNGETKALFTGVGSAYPGPINNLRFTSTLYNGRATGQIDDIRVSNGDIYGFLTGPSGMTYPVPTALTTVTGSTAAIYRTSSNGFLHVRTPIAADTSVLGWDPVILEVLGDEGVDSNNNLADIHHEFKALLNVNGGNNDWYGSQIMNNSGQNSNPFVYRSASTYGGKTRVCFAIPRKDPCANGNIWVRWWNKSNVHSDFAWATATSSSLTSSVF
jgi:hypothetical protein